MSKKHNYQFTWFSFPEDWEQKVDALFQNEKIKYIICGHEICPTTGKPHKQSHIDCHQQYTIKALQKILQKYGIKPSVLPFKTKQHCINSRTYCKKDGKFVEWGTPPQQGKRNDLEKYMETIRDNPETKEITLMEQHSTVMAKYPAFANKYKLLSKKLTNLTWDDEDPPNEWHYGPPGVGKSRPFQEMDDIYTKMPNKWWTGYDGQDLVLIEDLEPAHHVLGYYIKIWTDHYVFNACVHFGMVRIRPKRIIITSNFHPQEIFHGKILQAIMRRLKIIHHPPKVPESILRAPLSN